MFFMREWKTYSGEEESDSETQEDDENSIAGSIQSQDSSATKEDNIQTVSTQAFLIKMLRFEFEIQ